MNKIVNGVANDFEFEMPTIKFMNNDEIRDVCLKKDYEIFKKDKEIERLNNIINELEKWLIDVDIFQMNFIENKEHITPYKAVLDKLKELKGENNETN